MKQKKDNQIDSYTNHLMLGPEEGISGHWRGNGIVTQGQFGSIPPIIWVRTNFHTGPSL